MAHSKPLHDVQDKTQKLRGPQVVLSSNLPFYRFAAYALAEQGLLKRYICTIAIHNELGPLAQLLPVYWRKKLLGRRLEGLPRERVNAIWSSELLQKGAPRLRLLSIPRANWVSNRLFDRLACRLVEPADLFHFSTAVGLLSARRAQELGAAVICDVRTEYPVYQNAILAEEQGRLGIPIPPPDALDSQRIDEEFEIADSLIVTSNYARETFIAAGYPADSIYAVCPGVELSLFSSIGKVDPMRREREQAAEKVFRVIFAGQIIPRKGLHYLVEAFRDFDIPNAELLLMGRIDPSMAEWLNKAIRRDPRIRAVGSVPQVALPNYYKTGSVFVLPSLSDSWGHVTLEAMASGLPAIVTTNTGTREAVRHGLDGFVVPIRSPDAIADKLWRLHNDPALRRRMGKSAAQRAKHFSWKHYGTNLLQVYNEVAQMQ